MESVDCGVDEKRCQLSYDRSASELKSLPDSSFSFEIELCTDDDAKSVGVFEIRNGGNVLRRNQSQPFTTGALAKVNLKVNKQNCNVTVKKHDAAINLKTTFE